MSRAIDQFEEVSIDRLTEKQPLERCRTQRINQFATGLGDALPHRGKVVERMEQGDVASELGFEWRHHEAFDEEDMKFLALTDVEPARVYW